MVVLGDEVGYLLKSGMGPDMGFTMTKRAQPIFTVKQYASHEPWICIEYATAEEGMPNDLFGFDVRPGTSFQKAEEIARYMNENIGDFTFTKLK